MGNDHATRKLAKKRRKSLGSDDKETAGRIRAKPAHKRPRSVTKQMCYQVPPLPPSLQEVEDARAEDDMQVSNKASRKKAWEARAEAAAALAKTKDCQRQAAKQDASTSISIPDEKLEPFVSCKKFNGAKPGYVFGRGSRGQGYYLDAKEQKKMKRKPASASAAAARPKTQDPITTKAKPGHVQKDASKPTDQDSEVPSQFQAYLAALHYEAAMPIQRRCWGESRKDLLVVAPPGSGKTLAYILPAAMHCSLIPDRRVDDATEAVPSAVVLVPTRELATQVMTTARLVKKIFKVTPVVVYGGTPLEEQADLLVKSQPQLVIATPGRAVHLVKNGKLRLHETSFLVLDEADKMMQLGFQDQLLVLRESLPTRRRTVMLSATFPDSVAAEAAGWLRKPLCLRAKATDAQTDANGTGSSTPKTISSAGVTITETVHVCAEHKKPRKLLNLLTKAAAEAKASGRRNATRTLVFANTIKTVKFIGDTLDRHQTPYSIFHGGQNQKQREKVLQNFKAGKISVMVATDVAGRGLHISGLEQVVNWDFPGNMEQYIHRVGRTGRNNCPGSAFTFFTRKFAPVATSLVVHLKARGQAVDPNLAKLAEIAEQAGMATETMDVDNSDAEDAHGDARTAANDGADDNEDDLSEDEIERRDMADFNSDGGSSKSKPPRKRAATPAFKGRAGSANGTPKSQKSNKKNARMHTSE